MKSPAFLLLILATFSFSSCRFIGSERVRGNGVSVTQERQVGDFTGVSASGSMDVIVNKGPQSTLRIEADENLLQFIETHNDNGTVEVYTREGFNLDPRSGIKIYATAPSFRRIDVSGSGKIKSNGKITSTDELHTEVSGSGDILLDVDAPRIEAEIAGSGTLTMKGNTRDFSAQVSGSGDVRCFDLMSENTEVDVAGSGNVEVFASKKLDIEVAGAGDVRYKGNPAVSQNIAGSGNVKKAD